MGRDSKIEWTDHTFNPWIGCTKVSPGCANCYAETLNNRMKWTVWGEGERKRTSVANWRQPRRWNEEAAAKCCGRCDYDEAEGDLLAQCPACSRRPRVFCASLADWLDVKAPTTWRALLMNLIEGTSRLNWLLLTKRPGAWRARMQEAAGLSTFAHTWWANEEPPDNVWVGTSVENQKAADVRIHELIEIPARVRFLSVEPLLGPVDLSAWLIDPVKPLLDWVIVGGESGPKARPMDPEWVRLLRAQCEFAGVPFFFKQWGGVNKSATGRELDGQTWDQIPFENAPSSATEGRP